MFRKSLHEHDSLSAYLDGQVSPAERRRIEQHLAVCPECAGELESLRRVVAALRQCPPVRSRRSFALTEAQAQSLRRWPLLVRLAPYGTAVAAALLVLVVLADVTLFSPATSRQALAPAAPAAVYFADDAGVGSHITSDAAAVEPTEAAAMPTPLPQIGEPLPTATSVEALEKAAAPAPVTPVEERSLGAVGPSEEALATAAVEAFAAEGEEPTEEAVAQTEAAADQAVAEVEAVPAEETVAVAEAPARSAYGEGPRATPAATAMAGESGGSNRQGSETVAPEAIGEQAEATSTAEPRAELDVASAPSEAASGRPWWFWALRAMEAALIAAMVAGGAAWWWRERGGYSRR